MSSIVYSLMTAFCWLSIVMVAIVNGFIQLIIVSSFIPDSKMVELRKRKEAPPAPEKPAKKSAGSKLAKAKDAVTKKVEEITDGKGASTTHGLPAVGSTVDLAGFGGEVETNDGVKVTLKGLLDESKAGVVLFTYPKASTPGCTKQACIFRDAYSPLTTTGLAIYGLSTDSPKSNTTFKTKQNLPYPLLCDPSQTLLKAIGLAKAPKSAKRGVFVVAKDGKVLAAEEGGPQATADAVQKVVQESGKSAADVKPAAVAASA